VQVGTVARNADCTGIVVGCKNLYRNCCVVLTKCLSDQHGNRESLFARGATGNPHADGLGCR
jgi:hypothetical protein